MQSIMGPFGPGTPLVAAAPPTGTAGVRYLNPATRDYQQDGATGQLAQMPSLRQRVLLSLMTVLGSSSALPLLGIRIPRKQGPQFESEITAEIRFSLRQLTDVEQIARLDGVKVERGAGGRARVTVSYTDLDTGHSDEVVMGAPAGIQIAATVAPSSPGFVQTDSGSGIGQVDLSSGNIQVGL
jgi:hypothetical protein